MPLELEWGQFCEHDVSATAQRECHERHRMVEEGHAKSSVGASREQHNIVPWKPDHNISTTYHQNILLKCSNLFR